MLDLSDNEVRKLDNFPRLGRLHTLLVHNNKVGRIADGLAASLPSLQTVVLNNNVLSSLHDLLPLAAVRRLTTLSLLGNPVARHEHYRLFVAHKMPSVRLLDFCKIKADERKRAEDFFASQEGKDLLASVDRSAAGGDADADAPMADGDAAPAAEIDEETMGKLKEAIKNAKSIEELQKLQEAQRTGDLSGLGL